MIACVYAQGLMHEVHCEHFQSDRDGRRTIKLDLVCGGYVHAQPDEPWKLYVAVTCFWCIVGTSRYRIDGSVQIAGVVTGRMSSMQPNISMKPRQLGKPR